MIDKEGSWCERELQLHWWSALDRRARPEKTGWKLRYTQHGLPAAIGPADRPLQVRLCQLWAGLRLSLIQLKMVHLFGFKWIEKWRPRPGVHTNEFIRNCSPNYIVQVRLTWKKDKGYRILLRQKFIEILEIGTNNLTLL